jgi:hypothetical protein
LFLKARETSALSLPVQKLNEVKAMVGSFFPNEEDWG